MFCDLNFCNLLTMVHGLAKPNSVYATNKNVWISQPRFYSFGVGATFGDGFGFLCLFVFTWILDIEDGSVIALPRSIT